MVVEVLQGGDEHAGCEIRHVVVVAVFNGDDVVLGGGGECM